MEGFKKLAVLFSVLFVVSTFVTVAEACTCEPIDRQTKFCDSDFAAIVTIKERSGFPNEFEAGAAVAEYGVEVNHVMKMPNDVDLLYSLEKKNTNNMTLYTSPHDSLCGLTDINIGETYLIGGNMYDNKVHINACGLNQNWDTIMMEEQLDILQSYSRDCANLFVKNSVV